ncbi:methyltransferase [Patescibacteria group bacterium]|nr:methyltransferase [Patescibacteria group bacterium]
MDKIITEQIKGFEVKYHTLPGVFSAHGLDNGTRLLIDHLMVEDGSLVADLGSGTGVLGIMLAKLNPHGHVHLLDDHLRSYELAKQNVVDSQLNNAECFLSDLFSAVPGRTYQQIFANPPAQLGNEFLEEVIEECFKHLKLGGEVQMVVPKQLKPVMVRLFEKIFTNSTIVAMGKEHIVLSAQKLSAKS